MPLVQLSKCGIFSVNIPTRLARRMKLQKGENAVIRKGKTGNEFIVTIEKG